MPLSKHNNCNALKNNTLKTNTLLFCILLQANKQAHNQIEKEYEANDFHA
jgi:hypothetical protein